MLLVESEEFMGLQASAHDVIAIRRAYVDVAGGDLIAGVILSELVYWHLPSKDGNPTRLRVKHDDRMWAAIAREEWWDRCRVRPHEADAAIKKLVASGIVLVDYFMFDSKRTTHLSINVEVFVERLRQAIAGPPPPIRKERKPYTRKGANEYNLGLKYSDGGFGKNQRPITVLTDSPYEEGNTTYSGGQPEKPGRLPVNKKQPIPDELLILFIQESGVPEPEPSSKKEYAEYQTLWHKPLYHVHHVLCADNQAESTALIRQAIQQMRERELDISSPNSIKKVATAIAARKKGRRVVSVY